MLWLSLARENPSGSIKINKHTMDALYFLGYRLDRKTLAQDLKLVCVRVVRPEEMLVDTCILRHGFKVVWDYEPFYSLSQVLIETFIEML